MRTDHHDLEWLRGRRERARRLRHVARIDVAIGVSAAIVAVLVVPGLAYVAMAAVGLLIVLVGLQLAIHRGARRRGRRHTGDPPLSPPAQSAVREQPTAGTRFARRSRQPMP